MLLLGCAGLIAGKDAVLFPPGPQEKWGSFQVLTAKQSSMLAASGRTLHIELPRAAARTSSREVCTGLLGDFFTRSAAFLMLWRH
jgi:hypothetical protein